MRRKISPTARRYQDYLRRKGLSVGAVYMRRLMSLRAKEVRRVLDICRDYDVSAWPGLIDNSVNEASYLLSWYESLYTEAGLPNARSVARGLSKGKAYDASSVWERRIREYARERAGRNIVSVSGTLKEGLRDIIAEEMAKSIDSGVELLAVDVYKRFSTELNLWQCRRIARTETMIGLAESADVASQSLGIPFTKQWCCSGLANTRDSHKDMDGMIVDEGDYFEVKDKEGSWLMLYPHDNSTNPPAQEIINCACSCIRMPK